MIKHLLIALALLSAPASAAYYAEIDENNIVLRVVVINDDVEIGELPNPEANGIAWCQAFFDGGVWVKTFQDGQRKHYGRPGYTYRSDIDAFVAPKPYPSWTLDLVTANWIAPFPRPNDGHFYYWDEQSQTWVLIN